MSTRLGPITRISGAIRRRAAWMRRAAWQRRHLDQNVPRSARFLVGSQRSGTNMFMDVVSRAPEIRVYNEGDRPAFRNFRLAPPDVVARLIRRSPAPTLLFKPLCDSQWTDRLLDRHPRSQAVWMYRHYSDVVNSLVRKFGSHQRETIDAIHAGRLGDIGWRAERLSPESLDMVKRLWRDDLGDHEAGVLTWCLRNRLFFELGLDADERVRVVKYEPLVEAPRSHFPAIFAFLGLEFVSEYVDDVFADSIERERFPAVAPEIGATAEALMRRLDAAYEAGQRVRE